MTGRAVLLLRRRRPIGEPVELEPGPTPDVDVYRGSAGAARVRLSLAELGVSSGPLEQAILQPTVTARQLERIDMGRRYPVVVLGSHFVNTPDDALRRALLGAAGRHLVRSGQLIVEHHPIDWLATAAPTSPTPGAAVGMEDVRVDPPFVHAVSTYDVGGRTERVPFTARVLSEDELDESLALAGLQRRRRLGLSWLLAGQA